MQPQTKTPTYNLRGVGGIIHRPRTLMCNKIGQLRDTQWGICTYLETAFGTVERREVIGMTISHDWHTQCFLRCPISLVSNTRELQD